MENRVRDAFKGIDLETLNEEERKTIRRIAYLVKKAASGRPMIERSRTVAKEFNIHWAQYIDNLEDAIPFAYPKELSYHAARYRIMKSWESFKKKNPEISQGLSISISYFEENLVDITIFDIAHFDGVYGVRATKKRVQVQKYAIALQLKKDKSIPKE